ncbi:MAG: hypothetical protein AAF772_16150 [Acidobacteriota bacterium]
MNHVDRLPAPCAPASFFFASLGHASCFLAALLLVVLAHGAAAQTQTAPIAAPVVFVHHEGATEALYVFASEDGRGAMYDRLRRSPTTVRPEPTANLFELIGRPSQPAVDGEILSGPIYRDARRARSAYLVETSTGYVAFVEDMGDSDDGFGLVVPAIGRPFGALATTDGNYALFTRRDRRGRTVGALLYHATTGRGRYLEAIEAGTERLSVTAFDGLPALSGRVSSVDLLIDRETVGHLVVDNGNGDLYAINVTAEGGYTARRTDLNLFGLVPRSASASASAPLRFVPVALDNGDSTTRSVLVIDLASGVVVRVDEVTSGEPPSLRRLGGGDLASVLRLRGGGARALRAVSRHSSGGAVIGLWLVDANGPLAYLDDFDAESGLGLTPVETASDEEE